MSAYPADEVVYRTDAFRDREVIRPRDNSPAVGLLGEPGGLGRFGIAYPVSWIAADEEAGRPAETVWRLVVSQVEVPGRFVLRRGEFRCVPGPA
jgi:hypothetical protein